MTGRRRAVSQAVSWLVGERHGGLSRLGERVEQHCDGTGQDRTEDRTGSLQVGETVVERGVCESWFVWELAGAFSGSLRIDGEERRKFLLQV